MRILVLCDRFPWPLTNGQNLRIFHYVKRLKAEHDFDLLCYGDPSVPVEIKPLFGAIEVFPRPRHPSRGGLHGLADAFDVRNYAPGSPKAVDWIARADREGRYDLLWVSGWDLIVCLPNEFRTPVLADAVDDGVLELWRELKSTIGLWRKLRVLKRLAMTYRFERRYFGHADRVLFVSDLDAAVFSRVCPGTSVSTVNNGVDEEFFRPLGGTTDPREITFEGSLSFPPNVDGVVYFCEKVFPLVREACPDAHFTIVGRDPPREVLDLASTAIRVTGFVDDVRPYIDRAAVFVCPLRKGAGIKNKILQAWSMAKPVVATSVSVGGLDCEDGRDIVVRDRADAFAGAVTKLLHDRDDAQRIGAAGRQKVIDRYTWSAKAAELDFVFQETRRARANANGPGAVR